MPCREEVLRGHPREIALSDEEGVILALLEVDEVYPADILREMRAVLGGRDSAHPLVIEAKSWPSHYLAGRPRVFDLPRHRLHGPRCLTPAEVRERLTAMGNSTVVAFQTRNPMHRIHEELTKRALQVVGGTLLIHPAVGVTRPQDVGAALRVEAYEVLVDNYYDPSRTLLSLMPLAMRFAGPREAVWHAIIRRNYGATHLIVGRDHAGPGPDSHGVPFYGPYDAQAMAEHYSHEIGVQDHPGARARLPHRRGPLRGAQRGPLRRPRLVHLGHPGARGVPGQGQEAARVVHAARGGRGPAAGVRPRRRCTARRVTSRPATRLRSAG